MSLKSRRELRDALVVRYRQTPKSGKSSILDEFIESTGYGRKYAIALLSGGNPMAAKPLSASRRKRTRRRKYGPEVEKPLADIWGVSGGVCAKRLVPFLPTLIDRLEFHGELFLCPGVKGKLLSMSISTAERLLRSARRRLERGISTTSPGMLLRHQIPIRTFEDWDNLRPGLMEVDLVALCGGSATGDYLYILTMTDICTGWTECVAITNRGQIAVIAAIEQVRKRLPFKLLGIDSDNGAEFINHMLKDYCDRRKIKFTRGRPYKKNDQCHVEQKNGAVVRALVGYARYEGVEAAAHLNKLFTVHRLALNYFEPSMKLVSKERVGSRVKKTYDQPKTPLDRLIEFGLVPNQYRKELEAHFLRLNPAKLRRDIVELEMGLRRFAVGQILAPPIPSAVKRNVTIEQGGSDGQNA